MTQTYDEKTQCAGADCRQREKCYRFINRRGHSAWASFDLQRKLTPAEPCLHRLWFYGKPK